MNAIARTPGVNVLMAGVTDLKATLGIPVRNPGGKVDESKFHEAISKMIEISAETGVELMIPAFKLKPEDMSWLKKFKMIITSADVLSVVKSQRDDLANMKKALRVDDVNCKPEGTNRRIDGKFNRRTNDMIHGAIDGTTNGY